MGIEDINWWHSIDLLNGTITPGAKPNWLLNVEADSYFRSNLVAGKSVLDIGAWDGFMSFEAERRGASRVVAAEHPSWSGHGWGTKDGFDLVHQITGSHVESVDIDLFALDPNSLGTFDVVLFAGVLYHLTDPFGGLKKAAEMSHDLLIVETATALNDVKEPAMKFHLGGELNNDPSNFWSPNEPCMRNMLKELGFGRIQSSLCINAEPFERLVMHAWKN